MKLPKVVKANLTDQVVDILYDKICSGELKTGEKLPGELELAEQLGVARPTVREALNRLIGLGLIERGAYTCVVAESSAFAVRSSLMPVLLGEWETRDLFEARRLVECDLVSLAVLKASPEDIIELKRINEKLRDKDLSAQEYWNYDVKFHECIASVASNNVMKTISEIILSMYKRYESKVIELHEVQAKTYEDHALIISAIENKNIELAVEVVNKSLSGSEHSIYELVERNKKK